MAGCASMFSRQMIRILLERNQIPFQMQTEAKEAFDVANETRATLDLYGLKDGQTDGFGWKCHHLWGPREIKQRPFTEYLPVFHHST